MSSDSKKKRICLIGCGPSGMSFLHHIGELPDDVRPEVVCYEKQSTWGGMWNVTWRTGITLHLVLLLLSDVRRDMWFSTKWRFDKCRLEDEPVQPPVTLRSSK